MAPAMPPRPSHPPPPARPRGGMCLPAAGLAGRRAGGTPGEKKTKQLLHASPYSPRTVTCTSTFPKRTPYSLSIALCSCIRMSSGRTGGRPEDVLIQENKAILGEYRVTRVRRMPGRPAGGQRSAGWPAGGRRATFRGPKNPRKIPETVSAGTGLQVSRAARKVMWQDLVATSSSLKFLMQIGQ